MKALVFDAGPVISFATNNLLWLLEDLKKKFNGSFYIPESVKYELVQRPIETKKFKFEAMQVMREIKKENLTVIKSEKIAKEKEELLELANSIFSANGKDLRIVHSGEIEAIALAKFLEAPAIVIDERTTRLLLENPEKLVNIFGHKMNAKITIDNKALKEFQIRTSGIKAIRSVELAMIAYENKMLDLYLPEIPNSHKQLIQGVLWGLKLRGCSITRKEIDQLVKMEIN
ncbi:hypothetical protein ACFL0W_06530 [Nanoarchaeota archaeon]